VLLSDLERMVAKLLETDDSVEMNATSQALIGVHQFLRSLLHSRMRKVYVPSFCEEWKRENSVELINLMDAIGAQCPSLVSIHFEICDESDKYLKKTMNISLQLTFLKQLPQLSQLRFVYLRGYASLDDSDLEIFAKYTPRLEYVFFIVRAFYLLKFVFGFIVTLL
jgi:hypothetical protein